LSVIYEFLLYANVYFVRLPFAAVAAIDMDNLAR
jgi:hypothetical protein